MKNGSYRALYFPSAGRYLEQAAVESFLKEGVMMKNFDHPHVLRLLGVSINGADFPMVILPYMCNGDLRSYVKNKNKVQAALILTYLGPEQDNLTFFKWHFRRIFFNEIIWISNKILLAFFFWMWYNKDWLCSLPNSLVYFLEFHCPAAPALGSAGGGRNDLPC